MLNHKYIAVDLFSGCGGLSQGLKNAGFDVKVAIENDKNAVLTYKLNHPTTKIIERDIRLINPKEVVSLLNNKKIHLLAGCPPCQGFSSIRRHNKHHSVRDNRNSLVLEYLRFVKFLQPFTIMMENVPWMENYYHFATVLNELNKLGYTFEYKVVDIKNYGIPQRRKRLVLVGSKLGLIKIAKETNERHSVLDCIGKLESIKKTKDPLHRITVNHTPKVLQRIKLTPKDGGSRQDLPKSFTLNCHKKKNIGFNDVYGRLRWDDYSTTITGGCLNPSKGRFLHPEENRVITPREAALLQTFPRNYKFPLDISKTSLALLIGNALPPKFSYIQGLNIKKHLKEYLG